MTDKKRLLKNIFIDYIPLGIVFVCIVVLGIKEGQSFIKIWPCLNSLFIVLLSAKANRWSYLIGAANCIIYSIGYMQEGLYGSVASAILMSLPIQLVTFVRWSKRKYKQSTIIEEMSTKNRLLILGLMILVEIVAYFVLAYMDGAYIIFESLTFTLGTAASFLIMFGLIEGPIVNFVSGVVGLVMWIMLTIANPANITYLLIGIYNIYRNVQQNITWMKLKKEQKSLKMNEQSVHENNEIMEGEK